ncbi:MAG: metalloregulator ArsR/SmtB family transcription factor [Ruminiclostridium sp.]|jgi:ArsR family transcriptional regulator|nr:metalloregulator ArsR/SmtB family transcription factor [Ruminiclostridium sp.]
MSETFKTNPKPFVELSEILKALSHPQRICIVKSIIEKKNCCVNDMSECLSENQPTVSRHISVLKAAGIIKGDRQGTFIYYSFKTENVKKIIETIINEHFKNNL